MTVFRHITGLAKCTDWLQMGINQKTLLKIWAKRYVRNLYIALLSWFSTIVENNFFKDTCTIQKSYYFCNLKHKHHLTMCFKSRLKRREQRKKHFNLLP